MKKKIKVTSKAAKTKSVSRSRKYSSTQATEHDFIIILGGGLVVILLTIFLFIQ